MKARRAELEYPMIINSPITLLSILLGLKQMLTANGFLNIGSNYPKPKPSLPKCRTEKF
jgi:hypothetical protein